MFEILSFANFKRSS